VIALLDVADSSKFFLHRLDRRPRLRDPASRHDTRVALAPNAGPSYRLLSATKRAERRHVLLTLSLVGDFMTLRRAAIAATRTLAAKHREYWRGYPVIVIGNGTSGRRQRKKAMQNGGTDKA
jgi:hypothetical protein